MLRDIALVDTQHTLLSEHVRSQVIIVIIDIIVTTARLHKTYT